MAYPQAVFVVVLLLLLVLLFLPPYPTKSMVHLPYLNAFYFHFHSQSFISFLWIHSNQPTATNQAETEKQGRRPLVPYSLHSMSIHHILHYILHPILYYIILYSTYSIIKLNTTVYINTWIYLEACTLTPYFFLSFSLFFFSAWQRHRHRHRHWRRQ